MKIVYGIQIVKTYMQLVQGQTNKSVEQNREKKQTIYLNTTDIVDQWGNYGPFQKEWAI